MGAARDARRRAARACRTSCAGCGSRTSRTSTSAFRGEAAHAVERAVEWVERAAARPDARSAATCSRAPRVSRCCAALVARAAALLRDPRQPRPRDQPRPVRRSGRFVRELEPATLLSDEGVTIEVRGRRVYIAGADPRSRWARSRPQPRDLAVSRDEADLRILIAHYPAPRRPASGGRLRPRRRRPHARRPDLPPVPGRQAAARASARAVHARALPPARRDHCTSPPGSGRRSCRFASRRGPRRRSWCYKEMRWARESQD